MIGTKMFDVTSRSLINIEEAEDREKCLLIVEERESMVSLIEECIRQLSTTQRELNSKKMKGSFGYPGIIIRGSDSVKSQTIRRSVEDKSLDSMETEAALEKYQTDSAYAKSVLEETIREIRFNGSFETLTKTMEYIETKRRNESLILEKAENNAETLKALRESLSREKQKDESEKNDVIDKLARVSRETKIQRLVATATLGYVKAWERVRCEQNFKRCETVREDLRARIKQLTEDEENETRMRREMEAFLKSNVRENKENIAQWRERYEVDWKDYSDKIKILQANIFIEKTIRDTLKEEQRVKRSFIDKYLAEKEEIRKEAELVKQKRQRAIKIQSWWRGVMVRRKLGPYRPEEKKKKKAGKSKK